MIPLTKKFPLPAHEFAFAGFNWPRYVATLPKGPKAKRLERMKVGACGPYYHRPKPVKAPHPGQGFYLGSDGGPGLRWEWCDEVRRSINHTGWFTDDLGMSETIRGVVFFLPKGRGFLAGWSMGVGMASSIDADIYDDENDAASAADDLAKAAAERQREYEAGFQEED